MSSSSTNVFFLTITIVPQKEGNDVPQLVRKISGVLSHQVPAIRIIHKFKVTGEAKVVAFVQVSNVLELERTLADLWKLGPIDVDCQPVICYENFAENINVADELCKKSSNCLSRDGLYWFDFRVEYHGHTFEDFIKIWKKEAETVLSLRCKGELKLELFKCLAQRRVLAFINAEDATKLDNTSFTLPIMAENGNNVLIQSKSVHYLDDYNARMAELKL